MWGGRGKRRGSMKTAVLADTVNVKKSVGDKLM